MNPAPVRLWLARVALALAAGTASIAAAQVVRPPAASTIDPNDPVERLGVAIRRLAAAPRDLGALLAAGNAALEVGDPNAALGFFARAEEVAPSSADAKAGLGSSLVMIERPDDALRLFGEAVSLGAREDRIAKDRGLAYDLRGDSRRAQHDYVLALSRGPDDEITRRFALSLGISGDRSQALAMLDPLLRKQDQGAWRARAFILAMTGDVSGANGVARSLMNERMATTMAPLLSRLATLNPAERAHAVNFGSVPSDGTQLAQVQTGDPYAVTRPPVAVASAPAAAAPNASSGLIPRGEPLGPRGAAPVTTPARTPAASPTRPVAIASATPTKPVAPAPEPSSSISGSQRLSSRVGGRIGPVDPARLPPEARGEPVRVTITNQTQLPPPSNVVPVPAPPTLSVQTQAIAEPPSRPAVTAPTQVAIAEPLPAAPVAGPPAPGGAPPVAAAPVTTPPAAASAALASSPPATIPRGAPGSRLAGLLSGLEIEAESVATDLPSAREIRAARVAAKRKMDQLAAQRAAEEAAKAKAAELAAAKAKAAAEAAAAKRNPPRIWVQVATGRAGGMPTTWKRLIADHGKALGGQGAWTAPYKAATRLLVGPMKSAAAARDLVATLGKDGMQANVYSSDAGEEIAKLGGK